ncbi:MAG: hypothetical protein AAF542_07220 [Pseudomonadota bacterium]
MLNALSDRRWHIASRAFAAAILGYVFVNTLAIFLAYLLPWQKLHGAIYGTLLSFLLWALVVLWAFSVRQTRTVWIWLTFGIAVTGGAAALFYFFEASP